MWIKGQLVDVGIRELFSVTNPATGQVIGHSVRGTAADAAAAVEAAVTAFVSWRVVSARDRAALLHEVARKLAERRGELAAILVAEQGKPTRENADEIDSAVELFDYYAGMAWSDRGTVNQSGDGFLDFVQRVPVGPVACIVPWNFPIMLMARKVAPALAAGNTVVIKPSEETPLATLRFAETVADHLPPGVFNVVTGFGPEVGEPLVRDPRIRHIAFTGSTATGQRLAVVAAATMTGLTLELGGKDALIIGPDVNPTAAIPEVATAALYNAGQCCTSTERIYVAKSAYAEFVDGLVDHVRTIRVGDGADPASSMGPLIRDDARRRVIAQVEQAVDAGARVLTGGRVPVNLDQGWFYEPTVVADVPATAALVREETFGPVLPVACFDSIEDAIARANDTTYGLGATVLSHDPAFIRRCIDGLEVGNVFVNDPLTAMAVSSFGGTKMSGVGRELGVEGFEAFRESRHVHWRMT